MGVQPCGTRDGLLSLPVGGQSLLPPSSLIDTQGTQQGPSREGPGPGADCAIVAHRAVVAPAAAATPPTLQSNTPGESTRVTPHPVRAVKSADRLAALGSQGLEALRRQFLIDDGVQAEALEVIVARWDIATRRSYESTTRKFLAWRAGLQATAPTLAADVVNFLAHLRDSHHSASSIITRSSHLRSMFSALRMWSDDANLVAQFVAGLRRIEPAVDKRSDPLLPLEPFFAWMRRPVDRDRREQCRRRALFMCRFFTLERSKDIAGWLVDSIVITDDSLTVRTEATKRRPISRTYVLKRVTDTSLCPVRAFEDYWRLLKDTATHKYVWRAIRRPFGRITPSTVSRIIKEALRDAGIDPTLFKPHELRRLAASHAAAAGLPLDEIQSAGGWASLQTMLDFYIRRPDAGLRVAATLLALAPPKQEAEDEEDTSEEELSED